MSIIAVVGGQWGDEGKGRIIDYLAQRADLVVRFQGGDNAGHTVVNDHGTFALHIVPSGIFSPRTTCLIGAGTVVHPPGLLDEIALLEEAGIDTSKLVVSRRAHVVLPLHRELDGLEESARSGEQRIGTTKRGIGPAYADKAARSGVRMGDLVHPDWLRERLTPFVERKNRELELLGGHPVVLEAVVEQALEWGRVLAPRIVDELPIVRRAVRERHDVLLEGQLGVMRDLDWGIYPFVTSSNPTASAAALGAGLPPGVLTDVIGVVKVYSTAVGAGPFPCELHDEAGQKLRRIGREYGATTGRPRRCGWFDGVAIRHAAWLNGFTALAMTKLDVLDEFDEIHVCVGYRLPDGTVLDDSMPDAAQLADVEPVYERWPGWRSSTRDATAWDDLPKNARTYLRRLSELAGVPIRYISVGPERDRLIVADIWGTGLA